MKKCDLKNTLDNAAIEQRHNQIAGVHTRELRELVLLS